MAHRLGGGARVRVHDAGIVGSVARQNLGRFREFEVGVDLALQLVAELSKLALPQADFGIQLLN